MKSLNGAFLFLVLLLNSMYFGSIEIYASSEQFVFHDDIDVGSSYTWMFKILNYQVPSIWSNSNPPFKQGDKITIILKENPSEYPELVGYYLYSSESHVLFDLYRNKEKMTEVEFSWFREIFSLTPFPFLPLVYINYTEQYSFLEEYYLILNNLEKTETDSVTDGVFFYSYTSQIEVSKQPSSITVLEDITENFIFNTSSSYYQLNWSRFTEIRVDTDTGLVDIIDFIVEKISYEYNYEERYERSFEAHVHYFLKLVGYNAKIMIGSISGLLIPIFGIIPLIRRKRRIV